MKHILSILLIISTFPISAQNLTLAELQNLCRLSDWETGSNTLTRKGWEYHDSKRGNTYEYSTITYAHGKNSWNEDRASAWFHFYTYNNRVEQVMYQPTDNAYKAIKAALSANGYKQIDNQIHDNYITTTYSNSSFILEIETTTQERAYGGGTVVTYLISLVRKGGIYDVDNGEKVTYYYGTSTVKERYTLKDGKRNGKGYSYYEDGSLESVITYVNGNGNGPYNFYYENGNPKITGTLLNNEKNGLVTEYNEEGIKDNECYYKNGERNGQFIGYKFNNGELFLKQTGNYLNDEREGLWQMQYLLDGKWITIMFSNYSNGMLHGAAKEWSFGSDSIVYCNYNYGKRDGSYQVKGGLLDMGNLFDDNDLFVLVDGYYTNGKKSGYWHYKNKLMQPAAEGKYVDDEKEGVWKYYYINNHIDCIANYHWGKLHGKYIKYKKDIALNSFTPSLTSNVIIKDSIDYICNYSYDELNGHYEQHDNNGNIIAEGNFYNNQRDGRWTEIDIEQDIKYYSNYKNGKLDGVCEMYSYSTNKKRVTNNYKDGKLDGRQVWLDSDGKIFMASEFKNGYMQQQAMYKDGRVLSEFTLTSKGSYSFTGREILYYTEKDNPDISHIITMRYYDIHPDSVLTKPFKSVFGNGIKMEKNGKVLIYDHQNREIINGEYTYNKETGIWKYTYYGQNLYYIVNKNGQNIPWLFYTLNELPFSGKFTNHEKLDGSDVTVIYKIKKSLIEEITYSNPTTGKTISKLKFKDGLPQ